MSASDVRDRQPPTNAPGSLTALAVLAVLLGACSDGAAVPATKAAYVRTAIVQLQPNQASVTLTGEVQARHGAELSFRVGGRVIARLVDVGAHVEAGNVLAKLDPAEQQADLDAATAGLAAAESQLRVAQANFDRQAYLISSGFTTRVAYDRAQETLRTATSDFEAAKAQLGRARDALDDTVLRAGAAGVITSRSLEIGQVVQAAQPVLTLAQDGERDAVFDVPESIFLGEADPRQIAISLVSDPAVKAGGHVREVSPVINQKTATVRIKVAIENPPAAMALGSAVAGSATLKSTARMTVPSTALTAAGSRPAVWIVDASSRTALLKPVSIDAYETGTVVIKDGLEPGERVIVDGGKLLSSGQPVTYDGGAS